MNQELKLCLLCKGGARQVYEGMSGYIEGTHYNVYECSQCLTSFIDPMSNLKEEYDVIYGGKESKRDAGYRYYYYVAKGVKNLKNPFKVLIDYTAIYWGVDKALQEGGIAKGAKILEVGSGLGYFTHALNEEGFHCEGLEYSETAVSFANSFFGKHYTQGTIEEYAKKNPGKYDAVIATEVIEHVEDPVSFIGAFLEVLKPGGKIIITTPNKDVHPAGTIWETDHAPKHLWWFTEKGLQAIAQHFETPFSLIDFTDYKKTRLYSIPRGVAFNAPGVQAIVNKEGEALRKNTIGLRGRVMKVLSPSLYMKLVGAYHKVTFFRKSKPEDGSMYILCASISK
jgi:2-polyprenyl-3-methyl-5-hydroxy-6-metoxy-1,4-benzoquinol methylase